MFCSPVNQGVRTPILTHLHPPAQWVQPARTRLVSPLVAVCAWSAVVHPSCRASAAPRRPTPNRDIANRRQFLAILRGHPSQLQLQHRPGKCDPRAGRLNSCSGWWNSSNPVDRRRHTWHGRPTHAGRPTKLSDALSPECEARAGATT